MIKTGKKDDYGNELFEGDWVKIGQLKGYFQVVWETYDKYWRMKSQYGSHGFGFGIPRYKIKKAGTRKEPPKDL